MSDVLIVEDSAFQRQALKQILAGHHTVVATAETGTDAAPLITQHQPDVILMDIIMPGIDGIEAVRRIRATGFDTPVVMITSVSQEEKMKQAIIAGADEYVTKPYEEQEILQTLSAVTSEPDSPHQ